MPEISGTARIVICGGPKVGKTTLAAVLSSAPLHTDDVTYLGWSEASEEVSTWFDRPGPWVIEGVATGRALRKWLTRNAIGRPCDRVLWLDVPFRERSAGQVTMAKGCAVVFAEIRPDLEWRGVEIVAP